MGLGVRATLIKSLATRLRHLLEGNVLGEHWMAHATGGICTHGHPCTFWHVLQPGAGRYPGSYKKMYKVPEGVMKQLIIEADLGHVCSHCISTPNVMILKLIRSIGNWLTSCVAPSVRPAIHLTLGHDLATQPFTSSLVSPPHSATNESPDRGMKTAKLYRADNLEP